jgi:hypothetical protein
MIRKAAPASIEFDRGSVCVEMGLQLDVPSPVPITQPLSMPKNSAPESIDRASSRASGFDSVDCRSPRRLLLARPPRLRTDRAMCTCLETRNRNKMRP